mmetsp:Transcript_15671/g.39857  ORF Transcript_15671/g.39857 Transcript_15671/m.39857 type:complete len:103 (-) Transcript_15671:2034-2342(-)
MAEWSAWSEFVHNTGKANTNSLCTPWSDQARNGFEHAIRCWKVRTLQHPAQVGDVILQQSALRHGCNRNNHVCSCYWRIGPSGYHGELQCCCPPASALSYAR